ncbi:MAG: zinc-ribbon domain-containing protein [Hyphomicrobiales bacterium]|nr:zinc-ribbon domain-containing protein [Hyphomicrobiales bacterium]
MLIVCPNCATSYRVEPSSIGAAGRSVRCVRCRKVWFASNTEAMAAIARAHHEDLAALADAAAPDGAAAAAAEEVSQPHAQPLSEPPADAPAPEPVLRDDRGPAPLPEPRQHDLPAAPAAIDDAPPLAPQAADPVASNIEAAAARLRRPLRRPAKRRSSGWSIVILALLAANAGLLGWRTEIVRLMPQTAAIYAALGLPVNLRSLVFTDVVSRKETQDGAAMLVVEGVIKSTGRNAVAVPRLRFAVRNAQGHEIYSWTAMPARAVLEPGGTLPFRARLASPPPETHALLVRFFHRRDLLAGLQ